MVEDPHLPVHPDHVPTCKECQKRRNRINMRNKRNELKEKASTIPRLSIVPAQTNDVNTSEPAPVGPPPMGDIESALLDELAELPSTVTVSPMDKAYARRLARILDQGADTAAVSASKQFDQVLAKLRPPTKPDRDDPTTRAEVFFGALACFLPGGPGRAAPSGRRGVRAPHAG